MQNSSSRRDERRRQRDRRKRTRPTKLREQLRAWRRKHDLSQSEAGLKLQISRRTLQEWEQGRAMPRGLALVTLRQVNDAIRDSRTSLQRSRNQVEDPDKVK
jgi:DNA-binding transcriptional regulator YiaG